VTGKYPPGPDVQVPTYVVNLDLPPQMRWADIAAKHKVPVNKSTFFFNSLQTKMYFLLLN